jgi:two-component system chemotaxis sensor kinase CheA
MSILDQMAGNFREEASERLAELETVLLELESQPDNSELIAQDFRAMHTIKGSGAMFGFDLVAAFTHDLETVFDEIRNGRLPVTQAIIGLALESCDLIRRMLNGDEEATRADRERLTTALRSCLPKKKTVLKQTKSNLPLVRPQEPAKTYRVFFHPKQDLFRNGTNPMCLLDELAELGASWVGAFTRNIPSLNDLDPESCYLAWDIMLTTGRGLDAIRDVFIFVEDRCTLRIDLIDDGESCDEPVDYKRIGEILVERGDITTEQIKAILAERKRVGELLVEKGAVTPEAVEAAVL